MNDDPRPTHETLLAWSDKDRMRTALARQDALDTGYLRSLFLKYLELPHLETEDILWAYSEAERLGLAYWNQERRIGYGSRAAEGTR